MIPIPPRSPRSMIHLFPLILAGLALTLLILPLGCASRNAAAYTATGTASINRALPAKDERRDAIVRAETQARDQIMAQAGQLRLPDGRSLEDLAVVDPFIRASLMDTVRSAHVVNRDISSEGRVTITLRLERKTLERLMQAYQP